MEKVIFKQCLALFDHLEIDPITLECIRVVDAPGVTHLGFRVVK